MTARAIGAATVPPCPEVHSTVAATAIWGSEAGAKPMNQAWLGSPSQFSRPGTSAVPVLTATSIPLSAAWVPVPSLTTPCIMVFSSAAVSSQLAPVGDRGGDLGHLQRGDQQPLLTDRHPGNVDRVVRAQPVEAVVDTTGE